MSQKKAPASLSIKPDPDLPDSKRQDRARAKAGELVRKTLREEREAKERAARRHAVSLDKPEPDLVPGTDLGASLALKRGVVEIDHDAVLTEDPDAKRPSEVRGPRAYRHWAPDRMLRHNSIGQHQHDAAVRFLTDYLVGILGAQPGSIAPRFRDHVAPWNRFSYSERRFLARQRFETAVKEVKGVIAASVLVWAVLQETGSPSHSSSLEAWAAKREPKPWPIDRASGALITALDALADFYGFTAKDYPSKKGA